MACNFCNTYMYRKQKNITEMHQRLSGRVISHDDVVNIRTFFWLLSLSDHRLSYLVYSQIWLNSSCGWSLENLHLSFTCGYIAKLNKKKKKNSINTKLEKYRDLVWEAVVFFGQIFAIFLRERIICAINGSNSPDFYNRFQQVAKIWKYSFKRLTFISGL
jgi:hypothetical protein